MPEPTTTEPTKIEFIQYHQPALRDGDYEITVTQTIESTDGKIIKSTFTTDRKSTTDGTNPIRFRFTVSGERFDLKPTDIHAIFPPAGSLGEHSNVLPHIILNRSTLPWERQADATNKNIPWLTLLLFDQEEKPEPKIITLRKLKQIPDGLDKQDELNKFLDSDKSKPDKIWLLNNDLTETEKLTKSETGRNIYFPNFDKETGQHWDDKVTVIDVKKTLLDKILPAKEDLEYLAHVREGTDDNKNLVGDELAVIIGNRLPKKGSISTVHLVSLEGRYNDQGFNFQSAEANDLIRLISLKSWCFACVDEKQSFKRLLTHLNRGQFLFRINTSELIADLNSKNIEKLLPLFKSNNISLSNPTLQVDEVGILWRIINADNQQYSIEKTGDRLDIYHRESSILRLPKIDNPEAEKYLSMGYLSLPHFLRGGGKTFSWYHSPLITGKNLDDNITLPIRTADELVRYNPDNGMFDISYPAAWELGRLLALQSKNFSISLYNWKRSYKQSINSVESHLPFYTQPNSELPKEISSWFQNLSLLKGVPFNYLIPDEQMLPIESIRFFCVDSLWIECLLDGAFSIGRVTTSDRADDSSHKENNNSPAANPHPIVTGFLLRSDVVAGWPSLLVDGYKNVVNNQNPIPGQDKLPLLRMDRLSANVLICLFEGEVKTVDIHQKPEALHFGLDLVDEGKTFNNNFNKKLKNPDGKQADNKTVDSIPWKNDDGTRTIDISQLKKKIETKIQFPPLSPSTPPQFTSAQFALEMIEGVEKVRFTART